LILILELLKIRILNLFKNHLQNCDGVMIGRAIYQNPYFLSEIEKEIFNNTNILSREDIVKKLLS